MAQEVRLQENQGEHWSDWHWQMAHRITRIEQLRKVVQLTEDEEEAIIQSKGKYRWSITPYYASLMDKDDARCPIRRQAVPSMEEFEHYEHTDIDPVGDTYYRKTNRVVHKYPDRALLLVTRTCPVYCRHCTRKYHTTNLEGSYFGESEKKSFADDFDYIARTPAIRDVLLSGGDPLSYPDANLEYIISSLRQIPHVEIIRIGSRFPVLLPMRITQEFCEMLEKYHPIWLNTHFNHPKEITPEAAAACDLLLRYGIPVQNQSVLLKGINDDLDTMHALLKGLLKIRVRPYYLYHCDSVTGVSHFVTDIEKGQEILRGLYGYFTGFGVPQYILTTKIGKIPLMSSYFHAENGKYWLENYQGKTLEIDARGNTKDLPS